MIPFAQIRARAAERKGGADVLAALLPASDAGSLAALTDDRALALMTKCIFRSGFVWRVIEQKWPGFEDAFLAFDPNRLNHQPDEFWEVLSRDTRIVRNGAKILATRHNAGFVLSVAQEHGSFGHYLANWPDDDILGLWADFAKRGKRLGGMTGRYITRFAGKDCFLPSKDVVAALRDAGLDIAEQPTSKRDLTKIQDQFNAWAEETELSRSDLSRICAMSVGDDIDPDTYRARAGAVEPD